MTSIEEIYTYKGFPGTIPEICKHFNLKYSTIHSRIQKGMSLEEAMNLGKLSRKSRTNVKIYTYKGFVGSLPKICMHFNINIELGTVYRRIQKGMCFEEALSSPLIQNKIYIFQGFAGTLSEVCKHFGVKYITVCQRMQRGLSFEEAIKTPIQKRN